MSNQALCVHHPTRPAVRTCARCGTFVCAGCIVSGDLCSECKTLLNRRGIPYSTEEKARASARRCFRWSRRGVQVLFVVGVLLLAILGHSKALSVGPNVPTLVVLVLSALGVIIGLGVAVLSILGLARSERGRPGPTVAGVFPRMPGAFFVLLGLTPAVLAYFLLLVR